MTIRLGPIDGVTAHLSTGAIDGLPRSLCLDAGEAFTRGMSVFMTDGSKVTCAKCIEWMHA